MKTNLKNVHNCHDCGLEIKEILGYKGSSKFTLKREFKDRKEYKNK